MKGVAIMVIRRSFRSSMDRVAIIAGRLHPKPIINGMADFPCRPMRFIIRSIRKATLAR
ncbi:MAG: hypothetical protein A4E29_00013 [Methanomassiliicoccales archaeon PtaB.Bin134]|nr:MAG: hypothetical protein A4E29_00013 [Methanomassiliicoccales archaeon PtaB.Bin134]